MLKKLWAFSNTLNYHIFFDNNPLLLTYVSLFAISKFIEQSFSNAPLFLTPISNKPLKQFTESGCLYLWSLTWWRISLWCCPYLMILYLSSHNITTIIVAHNILHSLCIYITLKTCVREPGVVKNFKFIRLAHNWQCNEMLLLIYNI